jgi:ribosome-associated toxin RatA of RatAB toxin-antitoxin module
VKPTKQVSDSRQGKQIRRQAIVGCPAALLYALVNKIECYPQWFDWCTSSRVLSHSADEIVAELGVKLAGIGLSFSTRNRLEPESAIHLHLQSGPFRSLQGAWQFEPLGLSGCRVSLVLTIDFAGSVVNAAIAAAVGTWADRMVDDFIQVAKKHV